MPVIRSATTAPRPVIDAVTRHPATDAAAIHASARQLPAAQSSVGDRGPRPRSLLVALVSVVVLLAAPLALASGDEEGDEDTFPHDLAGVTLCVDGGSVALHLDGMAPARRPAARNLLAPGVSKALGTWLKRLAPGAVATQRSCAGSASYVAIDLRIDALDAATYRAKGPAAFSYAIWIQVGDYVAPQARRADSPTLRGLRFEAYDEHVSNEGGPRRVRAESLVMTQSQLLLATLVDAYGVDNP